MADFRGMAETRRAVRNPGMKSCPRCQHVSAYRLADGRRKCRRCGQRYTWTSAWDSIRLPEALKRQLLRQFAIGVPPYRVRPNSGVSLKTRERFNRLVRAACALEEGVARATAACELLARPPGRGIGRAGYALRAVEFGAVVRDGRIALQAGTPRGVSLQRLERLPAHGPIDLVTPEQARMTLPLRGGRVVCPVWNPARPAPAHHSLARFCHFAIEWLRPYGAVRREYFHLHLGEVCYRFNRPGAVGEEPLRRLLRARPIHSLRPLLVRRG